MELYFSVNKDSELYKQWFEFDDNRKILNETYNEFCKKVGIESIKYAVAWNGLYIIPTEKDTELFGSQLQVKDHGDGAKRFKGNSKVYRAWIKRLKEKNIEIVSKPDMWHYFGAYGRSSSRIFDDEKGNVYCSITAECLEKNFKGVTEMKASEFYKVIEDIKSKRSEEKKLTS